MLIYWCDRLKVLLIPSWEADKTLSWSRDSLHFVIAGDPFTTFAKASTNHYLGQIDGVHIPHLFYSSCVFNIILLSISRLSQWSLSYPLAACIFAPPKLATWSTYLILDFLMLIYVKEEGREVSHAVFSTFLLLFHESWYPPPYTVLKTPLTWVLPLIWSSLWFYLFVPGKCCSSSSSTSDKLGHSCFLPHFCQIHHSLIIVSFHSM